MNWPDLLAVQIQRADDALLAPERHDQLRPHARRCCPTYAVVRLHVVDEQRPALGDGGADDALADAQPEGLLHVLRVADGVGDAQIVRFSSSSQTAERLERRQARDELRDLLEQLVEVEDRGDLAAQLEQRDEQFCGFADRRSGGRRRIRKATGTFGRAGRGEPVQAGLYW